MNRTQRLLRAAAAAILVAAMTLVAGTPYAGAVTPKNNSMLFYRNIGTPTGYRATLANGTYLSKGPSSFSSGWSQVAIDRDSVIFYNTTTGLGVTGTYINGVFTQMHTYHFSTGWTYVVAGCNTIFFFNVRTQTAAIGTLVGGTFSQTGSSSGWTNVQMVAASCDSLLVYNYTGGGTLTMPMNDGVLGSGTLYHLSAKWTSIVATDDSVIFYNTGTGVGAWGRLIAGQFTQTGSSTGFSKGLGVSATATSLFFYTGPAGTAGIATLKSGVYQYVRSLSGFATNWAIIVGGK